MEPTLTQLRYLQEVARTGHFGRAADNCHVSQPTLSTQVQKAERILGVEVLDRTQKPIVPTPAGRAVLAQAAAVLDAHEQLTALALHTSSTLRGDLALGVIPTLAPYVLPWFLAAFAETHPGVLLRVTEEPTDALVDALGTRRVDVALLATPLLESSLEERVLFYDPFYIYAQKGDPLLDWEELTPDDLDPDGVWLLEDGHCLRAQVINTCHPQQRRSLLESVRFDAGSLETLRHLIDASGGATLIPETFARTLPATVRREQLVPFAEPSPTREVSLAFLRRSPKRRLVEALAQLIEHNLPRPFRRTAAGAIKAIHVET